MKVLLTTDTVGGVWTYALELAEALAPSGTRVALATMGAPLSSDQWRHVRRAPDLEVFESRCKLEWMQDPWDDVRRAGDWLLDLERRVAPDVVHLNGYVHGSLPWNAPKVVVAHSCVLSWWRTVKGCSAPKDWNTYRREVTRGIRSADAVVAPSRAMLEETLSHYGPLTDTRVIHNGRAAPTGRVTRPKEDLILTAGRLWDEAKNVQALADVADRVDWPLYIAGEAAHPDTGERACHPNVRWLGRLSAGDLDDWFIRAAIYALPARYEPFGLTALEAALAGCALVLGDIPSLREIWGDAAAFVPPGDRDALTYALNNLIRNPPRRRELAQRARARAARYTPERMAGQYVKLYERLLSRDAAHLTAGGAVR